MDRCSEFIKNKALFGAYPLQSSVNEYEKLGVRYFIDLTEEGEKNIVKYKTKYNYINYPIKDRRVPDCWKTFSELIIKISKIIKNLGTCEKIYIHCKGGHGRSGILVACLLCYLYKMTPSEAITKTTIFHGRRKIMKERWRKIGSPQTRGQKHFVTKFFEPLYVFEYYTRYFSEGFSNNSKLSVTLPDIGTFPMAISAYYALKDPKNSVYINNLILCKNILEVENVIKKTNFCKEWEEKKCNVMYTVLKYKFSQHPSLKTNITRSGLRPIIFKSHNRYWGKMEKIGQNIFGKLLENIRKELYLNKN